MVRRASLRFVAGTDVNQPVLLTDARLGAWTAGVLSVLLFIGCANVGAATPQFYQATLTDQYGTYTSHYIQHFKSTVLSCPGGGSIDHDDSTSTVRYIDA